MIDDEEFIEGVECDSEVEVTDDTFDPGPLKPEGTTLKETEEIKVEGLVSNMDQNYKVKTDFPFIE